MLMKSKGYYDIASSYTGTREFFGRDKNNPIILGFFKLSGHKWVEFDEVPWCAAFVGAVLEEGGATSTRKLNARSYTDYGSRVVGGLQAAQKGDIVVLNRGNNPKLGHVGFFDSFDQDKGLVTILGGNQTDDSVNLSQFETSRLLAVRRPPAINYVNFSTEEFQKSLKSLGYFEVGSIDGHFGPRTKSAIVALQLDKGYDLDPSLSSKTIKQVMNSSPRAVNEGRKLGTPESSRIMDASTAQIVTGSVGAVTTGTTVFFPEILSSTERLTGLVSTPIGAFIIIGFIGLVVLAIYIRRARLDDHRRGKTL